MPIYKQMTELTKCADWLTAAAGHDIQYVYFGDKQVFTVWAEYDGTLPATYSANGSTLEDYRVYGSDGGVGERTENLVDVSQIQPVGSYQSGRYAFECDEDTTYTFLSSMLMQGVYVYGNADYSSDRIAVAFSAIKISFYTGARSTVYIHFALARTSDDYRTANLMLTEGSTALPYEPYGYKLPMVVTNGTATTTTPIYIGSDPLAEDEYVDFGEQKIYRMEGGTLTPTDPPVPIPALPTVDGTNIVDYAGQSAAVPSKFVAKFRKEDF